MKKLCLLLIALIFTFTPALAAYSPNVVYFGGHGQDGDLTKSGSESTPVFLNARSLVVTGTWNVKSGSVINSSYSQSITGIINVATELQGIATPLYADAGYRAPGLGGGICCDTPHNAYWTGGSGAGFGGKGGRGGDSYTYGAYFFQGGPAYTPAAQGCGSAGGTGGYNRGTLSGTPGVGGSGGGSFKAYSGGPIVISGSGSIHVDGTNGGNNTSSADSAGGGGSGGYCLLASLASIQISASNGVTAKGGRGGNSSGTTGNGGGGGGGYVTCIAPSVSITGSVNVNGGAAGTGGVDDVAPQAGDDGVILVIQATPTYQVIAAIDNEEKLYQLALYSGTVKNRVEFSKTHRLNVDEQTILSFIEYQKKAVSKKSISFEHDKVRNFGEINEAA